MKKQLRSFEKFDRCQEEEKSYHSEDTYPDLPMLLTKDCGFCGKGKVVETLEIQGKVYGRCQVCETNDRIK